MITDEEKRIVTDLARKYKIGKLYLFGSNLSSGEANDIDLAVDGIEPSLFFRFYGELMMQVARPMDLVDLKKESMFNSIIKKEGMKIYG